MLKTQVRVPRAIRPGRSTKAGVQLVRGGPIRLGIVDDHPVFRLGLARTLERESDMTVAWELGSATDLLKSAQSSPVDVVLMDLNLGPNQDSLASTKALIHRHPRVKVIVLSALLEPEAAVAAQAAGASGYIPKDLAVSETVAAIRTIVSKRVSDGVFSDFLSTSRNGASRTPVMSNHGLTRREQEVLNELSRGRTNREIASRLGVSTATVNKHVQQVLKKLHVTNRNQAVARLHAEAAGRPYT
jgi:DNA-binding NarL/FixJ family response regulator